jgi:hypothetical protein
MFYVCAFTGLRQAFQAGPASRIVQIAFQISVYKLNHVVRLVPVVILRPGEMCSGFVGHY